MLIATSVRSLNPLWDAAKVQRAVPRRTDGAIGPPNDPKLGDTKFLGIRKDRFITNDMTAIGVLREAYTRTSKYRMTSQ
jgi:hypothetical protein